MAAVQSFRRTADVYLPPTLQNGMSRASVGHEMASLPARVATHPTALGTAVTATGADAAATPVHMHWADASPRQIAAAMVDRGYAVLRFRRGHDEEDAAWAPIARMFDAWRQFCDLSPEDKWR